MSAILNVDGESAGIKTLIESIQHCQRWGAKQVRGLMRQRRPRPTKTRTTGISEEVMSFVDRANLISKKDDPVVVLSTTEGVGAMVSMVSPPRPGRSSWEPATYCCLFGTNQYFSQPRT